MQNENIKKLDRILVANRGEIAIRILRAASELNIRTVAIYTYEDRYSLHRYKADEAYIIGAEDDPLKPYLDIEEIIALAKAKKIDAIHPGYGFLSENVHFAERCRQEGIIFIGPLPEVMNQLGDKVAAKIVARRALVPVIEDSKDPLSSAEVAVKEATRIGYPVIIKAAGGGGGRGMRVCHDEPTLIKSFKEAKSEAKKILTSFYRKYIFAFQPALFVEKNFSFKVENFELKGRIDRIDERSGHFTIVDYKTNSILPELFKEEEFLQPVIYNMAARDILDTDNIDSVSLYFLKFGKKIDFSFDDSIIEKTKKRIYEIGTLILQGDFKPKVNGNCSNCEFKNICPSFSG